MDEALLDQWTRDATAPFEGWDFAYLSTRMLEDEPPWRYPDLARAALASAADALDIATGGGEMLASLAPFSGRVRAVEGYGPNLPVAQRRLGPLGVEVFEGSTRLGMPFADASFDLVLNRHGGFRPVEMARILKPGGVFLTQQVGGDNLQDLAAAFGAGLAYPMNTLEHRCEELRALSFEVRRAESWRGHVTFADVGAIAYFLKAIPWVVEGFDVQVHGAALQALHERQQAGRPLRFTYSRFLIDAVMA
jgi:SAM-dependent methyltransferase